LARVLVNGKHVYLGKYNSESSRAAYRRILAEQPKPDESDPQGLTIVELAAAYLDHCDEYYPAHSTEKTKFLEAIRELRALYGRTSASEFGPKKLKAVRKAMIAADLCCGLINQRIGPPVRSSAPPTATISARLSVTMAPRCGSIS